MPQTITHQKILDLLSFAKWNDDTNFITQIEAETGITLAYSDAVSIQSQMQKYDKSNNKTYPTYWAAYDELVQQLQSKGCIIEHSIDSQQLSENALYPTTTIKELSSNIRMLTGVNIAPNTLSYIVEGVSKYKEAQQSSSANDQEYFDKLNDLTQILTENGVKVTNQQQQQMDVVEMNQNNPEVAINPTNEINSQEREGDVENTLTAEKVMEAFRANQGDLKGFLESLDYKEENNEKFNRDLEVIKDQIKPSILEKILAFLGVTRDFELVGIKPNKARFQDFIKTQRQNSAKKAL